jgi:SSS family solute:Na+ symporter
LRRNAVVMPLYTITLAFIFIVGFTAVLVVPGLPNGDLSLLTIVRKSFPPWFLGVIGGAGALTAMVPAAIFILTAAARIVNAVNYNTSIEPESQSYQEDDTDDGAWRSAR